jgi:type VI secretion system secreted protein VgrG
MASAKQANRLMQFSSPLGADVLLIESIEGTEAISRLFEYRVELLADAAATIDPKSLVGNRVTVLMNLNDAQGARYINGIVASFEQCAGDKEFNVYHARIVPALWQTNLTANCRVFQNKSALEIVKAVIGEYSLSISDQTSTSYKPLEYCTQYSESDFHFLSRLMEENGIFYWFEHSDQDHKIVLADSRSAYADCPLSATIPFAWNEKGAEGSYGAWVHEITSTATMVTGKHSTSDFDFRPYTRDDASDVKSASEYGKNGFDQYHYPSGVEGYLKGTQAPGVVDMENLFLGARAKVSDAVAEVFQGKSNARSLCAGFTFTLKDHPRSAWNRKYLLTALNLRAGQSPSYRTGAAVEFGYSNSFSAVASDIVFQPPRTAYKPRIHGPQTAKVVAPSGEDMYIDKFGRVCVQFFWDKARQPNTVDNTWVRVAQNWAGNGWGIYFWPRIDDEVVVQFLNGDPDNPIVAGSVYNGVNMPKYALPDHSTRSGLYTRSSKGGSASNANELRFEDKTGSEQIFLNAEKDMDHRIENDHRRFVGNNDSLVVTKNQTEQIGGDAHREIKGNQVEKVDGKLDIGITGDLTAETDGNHSFKVGNNSAEKVGMNYSMDAGMEAYLKAGMSIVIEAGMELTLKAAGGFINIGPAGVAISGTMVLINSGGAAGSGSAGTVNDPATPNKPDTADDGSKGGAM